MSTGESRGRASGVPSRRLCTVLVVVGAVGFLVLAWWLVPWHWVPGGHYRHVAPGSVFSSSEIRRAEAFSGTQRHLGWASYAVSVAVALLLGLTPLGARLVGRIRGWWWVRTVLAVLALLVIGFVLTRPFAWAAYRRSLHYGLTNQDAAGWWRDGLVGLGVDWAFTAIGLLVLVGIARAARRTWPVWVATAAVVLGALSSYVYPVVVQPLFNDFEPLPPGQLRHQIMALADKEHVDISGVLVADASKQTNTLNAYVSGFGNTRRVVLYDTLLRQTPRRQVLAVVAHELGHARHRDVLTGTVLGVVGGVAGVGLLGLLLGSPWLLRRAGARDATDPRVVPLVLALVAVGGFLVSPVQNGISRDVEARADRASLAATGDYRAFDALQRRLAVSSLADPTPPRWSQVWFGTHPTALQRIGIAAALRERSGSR